MAKIKSHILFYWNHFECLLIRMWISCAVTFLFTVDKAINNELWSRSRWTRLAVYKVICIIFVSHFRKDRTLGVLVVCAPITAFLVKIVTNETIQFSLIRVPPKPDCDCRRPQTKRVSAYMVNPKRSRKAINFHISTASISIFHSETRSIDVKVINGNFTFNKHSIEAELIAGHEIIV